VSICPLTFEFISYIICDRNGENNMAKANELKLYQREHFSQKIEKKLEPEIEREELKIKTTVNKILDKGIKSFSKSIGADKVIGRIPSRLKIVLVSLKNGQKNKQNNTLKQLNKVSDYHTLKRCKLKLKIWLLKRLCLMN